MWGEREKSQHTHTHTSAWSLARGGGRATCRREQTHTNLMNKTWERENSQISKQHPTDLSAGNLSESYKGDWSFSLYGSWRAGAHVTSTRRLVSAWWIVDFGEGGGGTGHRMMELYIFHLSRHRCHRLTISAAKGQNTFTLQAAVTAATTNPSFHFYSQLNRNTTHVENWLTFSIFYSLLSKQ